VGPPDGRRPKVRAALTVEELDGEAVVYDPETMDVHRLNPTATVILGLLDGSTTVDELAADVSAVFDRPEEEVREQLEELVNELDRNQILEPA
jgi:PqqD family protein of HPr-rel-A system